MRTLAKTKLMYHNDKAYIELRSNQIDAPIKFKQSVKVIHCLSNKPREHLHDKEEFMILTPSKLKAGKIVNTQKSQFFPYEYYRLVEFLWKPEKQKEETSLKDQWQNE